jgi:hypothetical protein
MRAIEKLKKALEKRTHESPSWDSLEQFQRATNPKAMAEVIVHIDALEAENERLRKDAERLQQIAHLIGVIFVYGNFVAETYNERVLEKLLRENNTFWESVEQFEQQLTDASKGTP